MKKTDKVSMLGTMLVLVLTILQLPGYSIPSIKADLTTVYILFDGSVYPSNASIFRLGDFYVITNEIPGQIVIQRSNIAIDGCKNRIVGDGTGQGFNLTAVQNVTIKNAIINGFVCGVLIHRSTAISISDSTIRLNKQGAKILQSNNSQISGNVLENNEGVIFVDDSRCNLIQGNNMRSNRITDAFVGAIFISGDYNVVSENTIAYNNVKEDLIFVTGNHNVVSKNNITKNSAQYLITLSGSNCTATKNSVIDNTGLAIQNVGDSHIITGNIVKLNTNGIYCSSIQSIISNNSITYNPCGISLVGGSGNVISGNNVTNSSVRGLSVSDSPNNTFRNNMLRSNYRNIEISQEQSGSLLAAFVQDMNSTNTVDSKPIYYWVNRKNMEVPLGGGYVALVNSYNITVRQLELGKNAEGILLVNTTNSRIIGNNMTNNEYGISLKFRSNNNNVSCNNITNNRKGIYIGSSSFNIIKANNITNCETGVFMDLSSNSTSILSNCITGSMDGITFYRSQAALRRATM